MGLALQDQNKVREAIMLSIKHSLRPDYPNAHRNLSDVKKYTINDSHFLQVCEIYKRKNLTEDARCKLSFALAKMYDDLGERYKAYTHLFEGNSLRKKLLKYSINEDADIFPKLRAMQPYLQKISLEIENSH